MEIQKDLLNSSVQCACGVEHTIPIEVIYIGNEIESELVHYLQEKKWQRVLMVADQNTWGVLGEDTAQMLSDFEMSFCIFPGYPRLLPTEIALDRIIQLIHSNDIQVALAVGSGVINDLVRYATYLKGIPYISLPTAPSMDGYASNVSPLHISGMKITKSAQTPIAIFAAKKILLEAPFEMIRSGFGDLAGKAISILDWKLSHLVNNEYFCDKAYQLVSIPLKYCIENASKLIKRDPSTIENLFIGLINSGLAMAMVKNSRPASGSEHHCSHFWDFLSHKYEQEVNSHGVQVGYATHWMMKFYQETMKIQDYKIPDPIHLTPDQYEWIEMFYGEGFKSIINIQEEKVYKLKSIGDRCENIRNLPASKKFLETEISLFDHLHSALYEVGIPADVGFLDLDQSTLELTFLHAFELRDRYTVFDFLIEQSLLHQMIDKIMGIHRR